MLKISANGEKPGVFINTEEILVGGQAVIEGVMMRTPTTYAIALRRADGSIEVRKGVVAKITGIWRFFRFPVLRGFAVLIQSLRLGYRALQFSYEKAVEDLEAKERLAEDPGGHKPAKKANTMSMVGMFAISLAFGIGLFVLLPLYITTFLKSYYGAINNWLIFNLVDGIIRVAFFLAYLGSTYFMKDIKRVFQYHGAEHKVVYTWESKEELIVENAQQHSRLHPRCGTSFLLFVMVVSILVFSLFKFGSFYLIFLSRILLLPLISGLSYELIRFTAKKAFVTGGGWSSAFFRGLTAPGLWLQRITTQEPSADQLEVAICALKEALELERTGEPEKALATS
ncbi:MAG: DUF1385 domain-containing protein [Acidobacteria bacterium]|nr:DUF1385 domain-containing protein [Acidobacteriota bacterium]MBI3655332.1 DUF1385 domain-containing protein [Acidobacteriota bacterium]